MKDANNNTNQEIKGKFVAREVLTCFSYEMAAILRASSCGGTGAVDLPDYEDIENFYEYKCPECGEGQTNPEAFDNGSIKDDHPRYTCPECKKELDDAPESEPQEVYEWWIVTEWLYKKLKDKGYPVLEWGNNYFWGRCTTGQAILLDGVISDICEEMGILEGQKYDWSKSK